MKEKERIESALQIAWSCAQIDGEHHKMWVIDQMVRALCGITEKYVDWVKTYESPITDEEYYIWDTGIKAETNN